MQERLLVGLDGKGRIQGLVPALAPAAVSMGAGDGRHDRVRQSGSDHVAAHHLLTRLLTPVHHLQTRWAAMRMAALFSLVRIFVLLIPPASWPMTHAVPLTDRPNSRTRRHRDNFRDLEMCRCQQSFLEVQIGDG